MHPSGGFFRPDRGGGEGEPAGKIQRKPDSIHQEYKVRKALFLWTASCEKVRLCRGSFNRDADGGRGAELLDYRREKRTENAHGSPPLHGWIYPSSGAFLPALWEVCPVLPAERRLGPGSDHKKDGKGRGIYSGMEIFKGNSHFTLWFQEAFPDKALILADQARIQETPYLADL